ncbi:MAG TPA: GNAT family N-acetyltransferase [Candidatus Deferrimicrobium sp.]|nr:GNAT family N-acetyltransferase [Candidatus Deferrimicrobium sp.]
MGGSRGRAAPDRFALVPVFPALETDRLILRELTQTDAPWYLAHFSRPEIVAGSGFPAPADLAAARGELNRYVLDLFARRTGLRWGLVMRGEHELIGSVGLYAWRDDPEPTAELGYDLAPEFWGRGLMTEAIRAIARYAFDTLGISRLEATVIVGNERSCRTLERSGFRHEGVLAAHGEDEHGRLVDEHLYALRRGG